MGRWGTDLGWLWQNPFSSDLRLQLCTTQTVADTQLPSAAPDSSMAPADPTTAAACSSSTAGRVTTKVARRTGAGSTAPEATTAADAAAVADSVARTFLLHSTVIASSSSYFKARLSTGLGSEGARDGGGRVMPPASSSMAAAAAVAAAAPAGQLVLLEHVEEGELDAMEALLRHCYTAELCGDGGDAAQISVATLLQMIALANRFDVPQCLEHCCEELAKRAAEDYDLPATNTVLAGLTAAWHSLPAFAAVAATATDRLVQMLGDAEAVGQACCDGDAAMTAQLAQLSQPSLLALLGSAGLKARSENSVLTMVDRWVASVPVGAPLSAAQLRQVVDTLRLGQLSPVFLYNVLPALEWLCLSGAERESLLRFSAGRKVMPGGQQHAALSTAQKHLSQSGCLVGPALWYCVQQRAAPGGELEVSMEWCVTQGQLKKLLQGYEDKLEEDGARVLNSRRVHFFNGFKLQQQLIVCAGKEKYMSVRLTVSGRQSVAFQGVLFVATCAIMARGVPVVQRCGQLVSSTASPVWLDFELVPLEHVLDIAAWQPHLSEDATLVMRCTVSLCA